MTTEIKIELDPKTKPNEITFDIQGSFETKILFPKG